MGRRNFIGKTAAGAAAITVIPRHVLGAKVLLPPMIKSILVLSGQENRYTHF